MDLIRETSAGDANYAEASEFVRVRELRRIRDGIASSGMMRENTYALENGTRRREDNWQKQMA
jgi:hypothetical protein